TDLAGLLRNFLPGSPHPFGDPGLSFPGIAESMGLIAFWPAAGSKGPRITTLLSRTLEHQAARFCPLVVEVVRRGIVHRHGKSPVMREDVEQINTALARVGFQVPELNDPKFLDHLPRKPVPAAAQPGAGAAPADAKTVAALVNEV